jgi:hypothetical protein
VRRVEDEAAFRPKGCRQHDLVDVADIGANRTEAGRHVDAMLSYGKHMGDRCDEAMRGIDAGNWGWDPMMHGCENWDGCCSGMMHDGCCGGMGGMGGMHGGGGCCGH